MSMIKTRLCHVLAGALLTVFAALPAMADDTEIYRSQAEAVGAKPNVLFIIDTSGSMDTTVVQTAPPYDPSKTYDGDCVPGRIYYSTNNSPPSCNSDDWFPESQNKCKASFEALGPGGPGVWPSPYSSRDRAGQFRSGWRSGTRWRTIGEGVDAPVECRADDGVHGASDGSSAKYIANNTTGWSNNSTNLWGNDPLDDQTYRFYSANYLNYRYGPGDPVEMTRLQIVRDVAINLASTLQNVNLGLMRYSTNAEGGMVIHAVEDIDTSRSSIINTLETFAPYSGDGYTPLSETLYEAARYLRGASVDYGRSSSPVSSVSESHNNWVYKSPIKYQCQKSYIVFLTDGLPTRDDGAVTKAPGLIGRTCDGPDAPDADSGWTPGSGRCADDIAEWLNGFGDNDLAPGLPGQQTAQTYMIGFGKSVAASVDFLNAIAQAGGTDKAYTAEDVPTLTEALQEIFQGIQQKSATFVTPSVSINAFNRTQASSDLYYSVFRAAAGAHWPGNLKKYKLEDNKIVDADGNEAVGSNGFFAETSRSLWSPTPDGHDVSAGGAAANMPAPDDRKIFTHLSANKVLSASENEFNETNLTDSHVGAGSDTMTCSAECQNTIRWARGDPSVRPASKFGRMGDPLHGRPAVVVYGGTTANPDETDAVVFVPTNDGFLHAVNAVTGEELWAFIPPELLSRLYSLYKNPDTTERTYGLDGDIRVLRFDNNQDGVIDASGGDYVWIFFGMRMGGNHYYGLDVTDRTKPALLWNIGPDELPGVGQTWSPPVVTRVRVGTDGANNENDEMFVLIFGGGYDMAQEQQPYTTDSVGNRIFMVDARTGTLLWYAGGPGTGTPHLSLAKMTNAIPGRITVIDTNGDFFADRMYAADMGGRVWRFDIFNGQPASSLVAGGVIAQLGAGSNGTQPDSAARRFFNAPDVALIQRRGQDPYYNIAIGSGHRGHPLDEVTLDRFYSIRDKNPYGQLSQEAYNSIVPIVDSDLKSVLAAEDGDVEEGEDITPADPGWKLVFTEMEGRTGEKVLSEATTVDNVIFFTTFQPTEPPPDEPCYPANVNRAYALSVDAGRPVIDLNGDGIVDENDRSVELDQGGIVGEVNVGLFRNKNPPTTVCLAGVSILNKCVNVGGTVRKFWERRDVK